MKDIFMLSIPGLLQFIFISKRDLGAAGGGRFPDSPWLASSAVRLGLRLSPEWGLGEGDMSQSKARSLHSGLE